MKTCTWCSEPKPLEEFELVKNSAYCPNSGTSRANMCKRCRSLRRMEQKRR